MIVEPPSSRQRAEQRRTLFLILLGAAAGVACLLVRPVGLGSPPAAAAPREAAPAEAAIRPNPPTEPVAGSRLSGPGG